MAEKINMPASIGGLMRYDESVSKIKIKPSHVILFIILVIVFEIILNTIIK